MKEITVDNTNKPIDFAGDNLQLAVSQQPRLYFDATAFLAGTGIATTNPDPGFITGYVEATQSWMEAVLRFQESARRNQFLWAETVLQISDNLGALHEKVDGLTMAMDRMASHRTFVVPLTTLLPEEPLQMRLNIPATIEGDGDDFTATFTEANVSASGETEADALANLKESLVTTYEFLESLPASEMGPLPARQWEVLRNAITR